jgi:hypothetical protein
MSRLSLRLGGSVFVCAVLGGDDCDVKAGHVEAGAGDYGAAAV